MAIGQEFEREIVRAFNTYADTYQKKLVAYRHLQVRYVPQLFDVLVDSRGNDFYYAIECKSVDVSTVNGLYFKKHFTWKNGICQLTRENHWLELSGRNAFVAVELRNGGNKRNRAYFLPWLLVMNNFNSGVAGIPGEVVTTYPCCVKNSGRYLFDDDFVSQLISFISGYPKNPNKAYNKSRSSTRSEHKWKK